MDFNSIKGFWRIKKLIKYFYIKYLSYPKDVKCNLCKWSGRRFLDDSFHKKIICPVCNSDIRHRLLYFSLENITLYNKKILHFAPEYILQTILKEKSIYTTADIGNDKNVDLQIDISNMDKINNEEFDILIASDVLEHVYDDKRAIREIYRILKKNGVAVITVPQPDNLEKTYEDLTDLTEIERIKKFGVSDHYRNYGSDFKQRLEEANFTIEIFDADCTSNEIKKRHVLIPPEISLIPLVTNHRKIYHALKK